MNKIIILIVIMKVEMKIIGIGMSWTMKVELRMSLGVRIVCWWGWFGDGSNKSSKLSTLYNVYAL